VRVVADSHAIVWYLKGSPQLSDAASRALAEAEGSDGIVVSVATLIDLWNVSQTTRAVSATELAGLRDRMASSAAATWQPIDVAVADATTAIPREVITDPWDRFIVGTVRVLAIPLVTRDGPIRNSALVPTIW
jgi:PIN domain nuclease of toxin-antitoxin system